MNNELANIAEKALESINSDFEGIIGIIDSGERYSVRVETGYSDSKTLTISLVVDEKSHTGRTIMYDSDYIGKYNTEVGIM